MEEDIASKIWKFDCDFQGIRKADSSDGCFHKLFILEKKHENIYYKVELTKLPRKTKLDLYRIYLNTFVFKIIKIKKVM